MARQNVFEHIGHDSIEEGKWKFADTRGARELDDALGKNKPGGRLTGKFLR